MAVAAEDILQVLFNIGPCIVFIRIILLLCSFSASAERCELCL